LWRITGDSAALQQTKAIPIVTLSINPVAVGFVAQGARLHSPPIQNISESRRGLEAAWMLSSRPVPTDQGGEMYAARSAQSSRFRSLLGGAAAAWPLATRAQQPEKMRRIGVLLSFAADDPEALARVATFLQALQQLGWTDGRNVRIEYRMTAGDADRSRTYAAELVALAPEVILASGSSTVGPLLQANRTVPIVFVALVDPVGAGFVASLARPGRNVTGFTTIEYGMSGKWLELLKQIAPRITRVAVMRDPSLTSGPAMLAAIQAVAPSFGVELSPVDVRDAGEIDRAVTAFARGSNDGLIVVANPTAYVHRQLIITLAAKFRLPAVYSSRFFVTGGGLMSYGPDSFDIDQYRHAAIYIDRILKGEKPADLPVQAPTKYELVINLKTAKALGLDVPPTLLARADEVIE
jgi:putative tryptophan/tyrosine transport system substrate-binding protein